MRFGYRRQWYDPNSISARFISGGDVFQVHPQNAGKDMGTTGLGLTAIFSETLSIYVNYDVFLNAQSSVQMLNIGMSAGF